MNFFAETFHLLLDSFLLLLPLVFGEWFHIFRVFLRPSRNDIPLLITIAKLKSYFWKIFSISDFEPQLLEHRARAIEKKLQWRRGSLKGGPICRCIVYSFAIPMQLDLCFSKIFGMPFKFALNSPILICHRKPLLEKSYSHIKSTVTTERMSDCSFFLFFHSFPKYFTQSTNKLSRGQKFIKPMGLFSIVIGCNLFT